MISTAQEQTLNDAPLPRTWGITLVNARVMVIKSLIQRYVERDVVANRKRTKSIISGNDSFEMWQLC